MDLKDGPGLFDRLAGTFQGQFFWTVHDLQEPFYKKKSAFVVMQGTWRTGALV